MANSHPRYSCSCATSYPGPNLQRDYTFTDEREDFPIRVVLEEHTTINNVRQDIYGNVYAGSGTTQHFVTYTFLICCVHCGNQREYTPRKIYLPGKPDLEHFNILSIVGKTEDEFQHIVANYHGIQLAERTHAEQNLFISAGVPVPPIYTTREPSPPPQPQMDSTLRELLRDPEPEDNFWRITEEIKTSPLRPIPAGLDLPMNPVVQPSPVIDMKCYETLEMEEDVKF